MKVQTTWRDAPPVAQRAAVAAGFYVALAGVEFAVARERASFIIPVPSGIGLMTIVMLLSNTVRAAFARTNG